MIHRLHVFANLVQALLGESACAISRLLRTISGLLRGARLHVGSFGGFAGSVGPRGGVRQALLGAGQVTIQSLNLSALSCELLVLLNVLAFRAGDALLYWSDGLSDVLVRG